MFTFCTLTSRPTVFRWLAAAVLLVGASTFAAGSSHAGTGFVDVIVKAPIAVDARVQGRPTDVVVNLKTPQDPNFAGIALAEGESIVVILPRAFVFDDEDGLFPVCRLNDVGCSNMCTPNVLKCTTAVFLQGWPQSAIPPDVTLEAGNRLMLTATADTDARVRQIHLITKGFTNPKAGTYTVAFERLDVDGAVRGRGAAQLEIIHKVAASINVFSVPADGDPSPPHQNSIYQRAVTGAPPPFDWFFLVWDRRGEPMDGMSLQHVRGNRYWLRRGGEPVGSVTISTPRGASGQSLELEDLGTMTTPVIGVGPGGAPPPLVQQYRVRLTTGDEAGGYETRFRLHHGNTISMFVEAEDP